MAIVKTSVKSIILTNSLKCAIAGFNCIFCLSRLQREIREGGGDLVRKGIKKENRVIIKGMRGKGGGKKRGRGKEGKEEKGDEEEKGVKEGKMG